MVMFLYAFEEFARAVVESRKRWGSYVGWTEANERLDASGFARNLALALDHNGPT